MRIASEISVILLFLFILQVHTQRPILNVTQFGAIGNGLADDTIAFQKCLNASKEINGNCFAPSGSYNITNILWIDSVGLIGEGNGESAGEKVTIIIESNDSLQSLILTGSSPFLFNLKKIAYSTVRGSTDESVAVLVYEANNFSVRNVSILGGKSAGILMHNSSNGIVEYNAVRYTLADAIHNTHCTTNMIIRNNKIENAGDDGIAVVSYVSDGCLVSNVTAYNNTILNQMWGRGMSVVGGEYVHYYYNYIRNSSHAAIYIASETSFLTYNAHNVIVQNNIVVNGGGLTHAAIMLTATNNDSTNSNNIYVLNNIVDTPVLQGIRSEGPFLLNSIIAGNIILNTTNYPPLFINFDVPHLVILVGNQVRNVTNAFAIEAIPSSVALWVDSNEFYDLESPTGYTEVIHTSAGVNLTSLQITYNTLVQPNTKTNGKFINVPNANDILVYGNNSPWGNSIGPNSSPYPLLIATNFTLSSPSKQSPIIINNTEFFAHVKNVNNSPLSLIAVTNALNGVVVFDLSTTLATFIFTNSAKIGEFMYTVSDGYHISSAICFISLSSF